MTIIYRKPDGQPRPQPKKSLGQNFLQDKNIARKIVDALHIAPQDQVLEIGPGPGALTNIIQATNPARLVLVEKDNELATERMKSGQGRCSVILADALDIAWERFSEPWKFIGNLPYNVASPLMWELFSRASGLTRAVFMIQKEVGLRLTAEPGTSAYGAISVWVQSFVKPKLEFIVPPQVFFPRPKVHSAVVSFVPNEDVHTQTKEFSNASLARVLHSFFQKRRKQLGTTAKSMNIKLEDLEKIGIDPGLRPENLSKEEFHRLSRLNFP